MKPLIFMNPISLPKLKYYYPLWKRLIQYPKYQPGDPQFRMYLCPFWMKMLHPGKHAPEEQVKFMVHPQMTDVDIKQYLSKIYGLSVMHVRTKMVYNDLNPLENAEDYRRFGNHTYQLPPNPEKYEKFAYVRLLPGDTFTFPDIFEEKNPGSADVFQKTKELEDSKAPKKPSSFPGSQKWFH